MNRDNPARRPITKTYLLETVPDRDNLKHQEAAGGDVFKEIAGATEWLLATLAEWIAGVTVTLRYFFTPDPQRGPRGDRLAIYLILSAPTQRDMRKADTAVEKGPLRLFYKLAPARPSRIPWGRFRHARHITRRTLAVQPGVKKELNRHVPDRYLALHPLIPRKDNDYLALDRFAAELGEYALADIAVRAVDISGERIACSRILEQYRTINHAWDDPDPSGGQPRDYLGEDGKFPRFDGYARPRPRPQPDRMADQLADGFRSIERALTLPHLRFNIRILSESEETGTVLAATVAESAFEQGDYGVHACTRRDPFFLETLAVARRGGVLSVPAHAGLFRGGDLQRYAGLEALSSMAPASELPGAFRFPIGSRVPTLCLLRDTDPPPLAIDRALVIGYTPVRLPDGSLDEMRSIPRGAVLSDVRRHLAVTGGTGSGKTTCVMNLLTQLGMKGISFLVFECANRSYRSLKLLQHSRDPRVREFARDLRVFTVGDPDVAPFHINPCELPPGTSRDQGISRTARLLESALPLPTPLPELIRTASARIFYEHEGEPPTLADLYHACLRVLEEKRYSNETMSDLRGALDSRLGTLAQGHLGRIFACRHTCPSIPSLLGSWSIFELDGLSREHSALFILSVLDQVTACLKRTPWNGDSPRLVIGIEEGHVVIGGSADAKVSDTSADTKSYATEAVGRMLAEFRALGVGAVIMNQLASVLAPEILKFPCTHIAFQQGSADERALIAGIMGLNPFQQEELMRLPVGHCFLNTSGYYEPVRLETVDLFGSLMT